MTLLNPNQKEERITERERAESPKPVEPIHKVDNGEAVA